MNTDAPIQHIPDEKPNPYVWIAGENAQKNLTDPEQTKQWAQNLISLFGDGFQWQDLPAIMKAASQFLADMSTMSLQEKRNQVIQILNDFVELTDTPLLPDSYADPIFHALIPAFVNIVVTDENMRYIPISGKPTTYSLEEAARDVLGAFRDGFQWQDLAEVTMFALQFAERYNDLTAADKAGIAKEIVDFVIDETDTPYLVDSISDPIFKQFVHPLIDTYFHVTLK